MRVLIVSDTHRRLNNLKAVIRIEKNLDQVLHLGDVEGDEERIRSLISCPVAFVDGNNDFMGNNGADRMITLSGVRIFMTHGHRYGVSVNNSYVAWEARTREAHIACYGHTHRPVIEERGGLYLINPGSLSYPRQSGKKPSYIIMTITDSEHVDFALRFLE